MPAAPDTVTQAVAHLTELGYDAEFNIVDHAHVSAACRGDDGRLRLVVRRRYRFEGPSDPGDEAVVVGLVCGVCGAKGIVVSAFGPDADDELIELAHFLQEDREADD
ncbi:MAG: hypothetical protein JWN99_2181 [Ilumatobacteraceae bacterium]|nr:hypothetical protein [Ilumatobacteraceae bacterium]